MPLKPGSSKKVVSSNVSEMIHSFKRKGTIGKVTPKNLAHARKVALAAAFNKAG